MRGKNRQDEKQGQMSIKQNEKRQRLDGHKPRERWNHGVGWWPQWCWWFCSLCCYHQAVSEITSSQHHWWQKQHTPHWMGGPCSEVHLHGTPEGRPGMSDVSPLSGISGLSFDSTLLSPLLFFCLVLLPFLSYCFLPAGPFFSTFSRKFLSVFR